MSKILEDLEKGRIASSAKPASSAHSMTQEELADVYFANSSKSRALPNPTLIRVVDKKPSYFMPWAVTTGALVFMSLVLLFGGKFQINVQVVGSERSENTASKALPMGFDEFIFSESASAESSKEDEALYIANSGGSGSVFASRLFMPSLHALGWQLEIEAKGAAGGENLEIVLKDAERRSNLNAEPIRPFPLGLSNSWQKASVFIPRSEGFDPSRLSELRIEIGPRRTGNAPDAAIWVRNLAWVPRKAAS